MTYKTVCPLTHCFDVGRSSSVCEAALVFLLGGPMPCSTYVEREEKWGGKGTVGHRAILMVMKCAACVTSFFNDGNRALM